jgi:uncharacterized protein (TIGR02996 family)
MNHEQAFIQAILENPDSDMARAIFADWLEENGQPNRSEFIKIQCELAAKFPGVRCTKCGRTSTENKSKYCGDGSDKDNEHRWKRTKETESMLARQHELLTNPRNYVNWVPLFLHQGSGVGIRCVDPPFVEITGNDVKQVTFHRGFINEVHCTHDFWCGMPCEWCAGDGVNIITEAGLKPCHYCHGSGRVNVHGPEIVRFQPVTKVVLTDRSPMVGISTNNQNIFRWSTRDKIWPWRNRERPAWRDFEIYEEIFDLIEGNAPGHWHFDSVETANKSLGKVALKWARHVPFANRHLS